MDIEPLDRVDLGDGMFYEDDMFIDYNFPTIETPTSRDRESIEQFAFSHIDSSRSLCNDCASLKFVELISPNGAMHSMARSSMITGHDGSPPCPLCSIIWQALDRYLDEQHALTSIGPASCDASGDVDVYSAAFRRKPLLMFLNPLCLEEGGKNRRIKPYQMYELSVWCSTPELLSTLELYKNGFTEEYDYHIPNLLRGLNELHMTYMREARNAAHEASMARSVARAKFRLKTSWCKSSVLCTPLGTKL
jgi:hypothetical protein